jgi:hypothetical protein
VIQKFRYVNNKQDAIFPPQPLFNNVAVNA